MTIEQSALLLTDLVLAAVAGGLGWSLHRARPVNQAARWWSRTLGLVAVGAVVGGFFHALAGNFAPPVQWSWWTLTLLLGCSVSLAMDYALLHIVFQTGFSSSWHVAAALKFVLFALVATFEGQFWAVIASYASSLLAWTAAALVRPHAWRGWMLTGSGLSVVAAIVQMQRWDVAADFDHNDMYHLIQAVALYGFYRAGRLFGQI